MKTINVLKKLITIYYYLMLIALVASIFGIATYFVTKNEMTPRILGTMVDFNTLSSTKLVIVIGIIAGLYYIYLAAIRLLKNSLNDLSSENYFSELVINNFKKTGKLFLICSVGELVGKIVLQILLQKKIGVTLDSSIFLFLIMGLFFMFLSEVFAKARRIQQENDLTI